MSITHKNKLIKGLRGIKTIVALRTNQAETCVKLRRYSVISSKQRSRQAVFEKKINNRDNSEELYG